MFEDSFRKVNPIQHLLEVDTLNLLAKYNTQYYIHTQYHIQYTTLDTIHYYIFTT